MKDFLEYVERPYEGSGTQKAEYEIGHKTSNTSILVSTYVILVPKVLI